MALWGASEADESKPKWLTTAQKKEVYANTSGWVVESGSTMTGNNNANAQAEVLCCIGNLTTLLGAATITEVEWITTTASKAAGINLQVRVRWNEFIDVANNPTLVVTNSVNANHTLALASGSGNEYVFELEIPAADAATDADDVLTIGAQNILLPGGATLKDAGQTVVDAGVAISGSQGTAAGSITVVA